MIPEARGSAHGASQQPTRPRTSSQHQGSTLRRAFTNVEESLRPQPRQKGKTVLLPGQGQAEGHEPATSSPPAAQPLKLLQPRRARSGGLQTTGTAAFADLHPIRSTICTYSVCDAFDLARAQDALRQAYQVREQHVLEGEALYARVKLEPPSDAEQRHASGAGASEEVDLVVVEVGIRGGGGAH